MIPNDEADPSDVDHETLEVTFDLSSLSRISAGSVSQSTITIVDDEAPGPHLVLSAVPSEISEISSGPVQINVTASTSDGSMVFVGLEILLSLEGIAALNEDYSTGSLPTISIARAASSGNAVFSLTPIDDPVVEGTETIIIGGAGVGFTVDSAFVNLLDHTPLSGDAQSGAQPELDSAYLALTGPGSEINEGGSAQFTVTLSQEVASSVTVEWAAAAGTASDGDFSPKSGEVTFPAGALAGTIQTFSIGITDDSDREPRESFSVTLGPVTGSLSGQVAVDSGQAPVTVTIAESDAPVTTTTAGSDAPVTVTITESDEPPVPGAPSSLMVEAGNRQVLLTWTRPSSGGAVESYQFSRDGGRSWESISGSGPRTTSYIVSNLDNGIRYVFAVRAVGISGPGPMSNTVEATPEASERPGGPLPPQPRVDRPPRFSEGPVAVREIPENSPAGMPVGPPLTATDPERKEIAYKLLGPGVAWFTINPATGQVTSRAPLDYEFRHTYRLIVRASDGNSAAAIDLTVKVANIDEEGNLTLSPASPTEGKTVAAQLTDPDGGMTGRSWVWESSPDRKSWTRIHGATRGSYTPKESDLGRFLRVRVIYTDTEGPVKRAKVVSAGTVAALTVNEIPGTEDAPFQVVIETGPSSCPDQGSGGETDYICVQLSFYIAAGEPRTATFDPSFSLDLNIQGGLLDRMGGVDVFLAGRRAARILVSIRLDAGSPWKSPQSEAVSRDAGVLVTVSVRRSV